MQIYIPEYLDVAAAYIHAHACLFVALAFSAFFMRALFCSGTSRTPHERMPLFFTRSSTLKVSDSFGLGAHIRCRNTSLFMFQFLFDRGYRRCSVVKNQLKARLYLIIKTNKRKGVGKNLSKRINLIYLSSPDFTILFF